MSTDPLDEFAPWPTTEDKATADAMIAYSLVRGQASDAALQWGLGDRERQVIRMVSHFSVASLLTAFRDANPDAADDAARRLWSRLNDGGVISELTWEWLTERGIGPGDVSQVARDAFVGRPAPKPA